MCAFIEGSVRCRSQVCKEVRTGTCAECSSKADAWSWRGSEERGLALLGNQVVYTNSEDGIGAVTLKGRGGQPLGISLTNEGQ